MYDLTEISRIIYDLENVNTLVDLNYIDCRIFVAMGEDQYIVNGIYLKDLLRIVNEPNTEYNKESEYRLAKSHYQVPDYTSSFDEARKISTWLLTYASDIGADGLPMVSLSETVKGKTIDGICFHSWRDCNTLAVAYTIAALKTLIWDHFNGG